MALPKGGSRHSSAGSGHEAPARSGAGLPGSSISTATRHESPGGASGCRGLPELDYPLHDKTVTVTTCGRICYKQRKINLSTVFAGQKVGIRQADERIWLVSFMHYDLGYFDDETCRLEPLQSPFGPKVLPMSPE